MPQVVVTNNRLTSLAADVRSAHADIQRGAQALAERAMAAGAALIEAKQLVPHGGWNGWLTDNVGVSERTARRYMQLARSGLKTATVADLGIRAAAEAVARKPKAPRVIVLDRKLTYIWSGRSPGFTCFSVIDVDTGEVVEVLRGIHDDYLAWGLTHAGFDLARAGSGCPLKSGGGMLSI